jgi:hypothetical protein
MSNFVIAGSDAGLPAAPQGRLIFGLDATGSRQATWDTAVEVQAKMFESTAPIGALSVQLVFYRADECRASGWVSSGAELARSMRKISCEGGYTQIARLLAHVAKEARKSPVQSLIFVGDAVEDENDPPDALAGVAIELGRLGVPVHMLLEGNNAKAEAAFRMIALRSGGQFHRFGVNTPQAIGQLAAKLSDVARLAVNDAARLTYQK